MHESLLEIVLLSCAVFAMASYLLTSVLTHLGEVRDGDPLQLSKGKCIACGRYAAENAARSDKYWTDVKCPYCKQKMRIHLSSTLDKK